jgi:hypothetical protein
MAKIIPAGLSRSRGRADVRALRLRKSYPVHSEKIQLRLER